MNTDSKLVLHNQVMLTQNLHMICLPKFQFVDARHKKCKPLWLKNVRGHEYPATDNLTLCLGRTSYLVCD